MTKTYKTALGKQLDMDSLRLAHEDTIAIGNMKVNARGDELGPGGSVTKTRNQIMDEYYKLNTPTVVDSQPGPLPDENLTPKVKRELPDAAGAAEPVPAAAVKNVKGNLANTFAKK